MSTDVAKTTNPLLAAKKKLKARMDKLLPQMVGAVPAGTSPDKMARFLFNAISANPDIVVKCTPESIADAFVRAATRGLEISDGFLGDCHLVPFGDQAVLIVDYKGIKKLVRNSGQGVVVMEHVREGDHFVDLGLMTPPEHHKAQDEDRLSRPLTHAYAVMQFRNGQTIVKVMSRGELIAHRNQYVKLKNYRSKEKAWNEENVGFPRMCEKTCVRQMASSGDLPLSGEDKTMLAADMDVMTATVESATLEVPPQNLITQTPAPEPEGPPTKIDAAELKQAVDKCLTPMQCQDTSAKLRQNYPDSAQEIYDALEAKRTLLVEGPTALEDFVDEAKSCKTVEEVDAVISRTLARYPNDADEVISLLTPIRDELEAEE